MTLFFRLAVAAIITIFSLRADEVTLVNGDRITGAIVKGDGKTLTVKTDLFGVVCMPWDKVKTISTEEPVHVELSDGETVAGKLETKDEKLEIIAEAERREALLAEVSALRDAAQQHTYERLLRPAWTELWTGTTTLGFSGTRGNANTASLTVGLNATRTTNSDKTTVHLNAIRASAEVDRDNALTARAIRGGFAYSRKVASRFSLDAFNDYEYDRFQNLNLRLVAGGGISFSAWKSERGHLDALIGGAYNHESFSEKSLEPAFTRTSGEAYIGDDFNFKLTPVTSMYQNLRFFGNMTKLGRYRFNLDLGARLVRWLNWNVSVSNRYFSSPVTGNEKNDFLYTTGFGLTFAR